MELTRAIRNWIILAVSCCPLIWVQPLQAQAFEILPSTPEAYQPFTLTLSVYCRIPTNVDIYTSPDLITVEALANTIDFICPGTPIEAAPATVLGLPGGLYQLKGRFRDSSSGPLEEVVYGDITVAPAPPTQAVYAFYNATIKHYFITAGTTERDSLLSGGGGGGWMIVDDGFKVWPAAGPAPAAAKPVCRFYSPSVNSHFYTAGSGECESLKLPSSGWTYEGIAFRALVPTNGSCYSGTTPVWRLYNNRFAEADSNHRFVASPDTYRHMIANGWVGEGVGFCSPP